VVPRLSTHKHWTRKSLAEWLIERLSEFRATKTNCKQLALQRKRPSARGAGPPFEWLFMISAVAPKAAVGNSGCQDKESLPMPVSSGI
jgi:hypothetical protein